MLDQEFKAASDAMFERRMKMFRYWTSITPTANHRRKHLSWYLDKRNRTKVGDIQPVRELDSSECEFKDYSEWADSRIRDNGETSLGESRFANPDLLSESEKVWPEQPSYGDGQINAARNILDNLGNILTENEYTVWNMKNTGRLSDTDIAEIRGVSPAAVGQMLNRIQVKLKDQYGKIRRKEAATDD